MRAPRGVRALGIQASDNLYLELSGDYNDSENEPFFYQSFDIANQGSLFASAIIGATDERLEEINANGTVGDGYAKNRGIALKAEYDFNENHSVKLTGSWRALDSERYESTEKKNL